MDGARKTAILLLSLDQTTAADVLRHLPREQVERVTLAVANAENVTRDEQEAILNDFKLAFVSRPLIHSAGPETARELLERSIDQTEVEPMQMRIDEQIESGPFAFLHNRHVDDIRRLIENEHSQTIAVVLAQLPPPLAADVLSGFPAETQSDVLGRLARLGPADINVLEEISALLKSRIGPVPVRTGGVTRAANMLRATSRSKSVLDLIEQRDSILAGTLRASMFSFEEIQTFDQSMMQVVLQNTDHCRWAVALKRASENLRQHVRANLNAQLAQAIDEEMTSIGPIQLSEITAAQTEIIASILELEHADQIELPMQEPRSLKSRRQELATDSWKTKPHLKVENV